MDVGLPCRCFVTVIRSTAAIVQKRSAVGKIRIAAVVDGGLCENQGNALRGGGWLVGAQHDDDDENILNSDASYDPPIIETLSQSEYFDFAAGI